MKSLIVSALLLIPAIASAAEKTLEPLAHFDEYVLTSLDDWKTPGVAVVIVRGDEILLLKGYGVRRLGQPESVDTDTVFPIASVTKTFTATGVALLVEEGKLKWEDPVIKHLPEFQLYDPYLTKEVTLTDLLSHRTGLERADILAYRGDYDRPELIRRLRYLQPVAPFRSGFGYHNLMVVTAGEILARVSGKSWEEFTRERILRPLQMNATLVDRERLAGNVSTVHVLIDDKPAIDPLEKQIREQEGFRRFYKAVAPAGEIFSSISDMGNFLRMYVNEGNFEGKQFLQAKTVRDMGAPRSVLPIATTHKPQFSASVRFLYGGGLGWQVRDYRGRKIIYHTGSTGAVVAFMPEEKIGICVLANRASGIPFMMMHDTFDRLLGIPRDVTNEEWLKEGDAGARKVVAARNAELEAKREKNTTPTLVLAEYAGTYESDLYGKLEISLQDGKLHLQFGPNMHAALEHWEHDTFRGKLSFPPPGEWFLRFVVKDGTVTRVGVERIFWHEPVPDFVRVDE